MFRNMTDSLIIHEVENPTDYGFILFSTRTLPFRQATRQLSIITKSPDETQLIFFIQYQCQHLKVLLIKVSRMSINIQQIFMIYLN